MEIILPTEVSEATQTSPKTILFYAKPKIGKTTALSLLKNALIVDTESGSDFVSAMKIKVDTSKSIEEQAEEFVNILRAVYKKGYNSTTKVYTPFYKYIIIDTYTRLDEYSEIMGTLNYMEKAQGKTWNSKKDALGGTLKTKEGKVDRYKSTDKEFETVHEIGQGYGYKHSREVMIDWFNKICKLAPVTIFVCHVKDKLVASTATGEVVNTKDINLTGKVKDIISSKVDTIMYGYRDGSKLMVNFSGEDGSRCPYLSGKTIVLTETDENGKIIANNWNEIFVD